MRGSGALLLLALAASALAGCIAPDAASSPDPADDVDPTDPASLVVGADLRLERNATWVDLDFRPDGATVLEPAARVTVAPGAELVLDGAAVSGVRFTVEHGGTLTVFDARLVLDAGPVVVRGTVVLDNATLEGSPVSLLRVDGGIAFLQDATLQGSAGDAVRARDSAVISHSTVWRGVTGYGVFAEGGITHLVDPVMEDTLEYGVRMEDSDLLLEGGHFAQECGVYVRGGKARVTGTSFGTSHHGVTAFDANLSVEGATFDGPKQSVLLSRADATLVRLHATNVTVAVDAFTSTVNVTGSYLSASDAAVRARNGTLDLHGNDLVGPGLGVDARDALVSAPWNWWGGDPPTVDAVGFERTSWLDAPATPWGAGERSDA